MARAAGGDVGKEVLSYCSKCKMDLAAVIMAMKGEKIAKVQCRTCNKEHVYRAPKGITEPGQVPPGAPKKPRKKATSEEKTATSLAAEWEKLMTAHKDAPFKNYSMKGHFLLGDKIRHPNFGEGIVGKLIYPNKVEVLFQNDVKVLIHGGLVS